MSGTYRASASRPQPAPRGPEADGDTGGPAVPQVPAAYGADGAAPATADYWEPDAPAAPPPAGPAPQRGPLGSQAEGMAAIRAVWERAAESERRRPAPRTRPRPRREPRRLGPALLGTLACACLLMFFAWTAAPALWIAAGHAQTGTVTVTSCRSGFAPSCTGTFRAPDWTKELSLTGEVAPADVGAELPARATGPGAHNAYVGGAGGLALRWAPALVLFTATAFALTTASGATRLYEGRSKAIGLSWIAAVAVLAAALAVAW